MNGNGNIKLISLWAERQLPPAEDFKIIYAVDVGEVRAIDSDGNQLFFAAASGDGNIYDNDGSLSAARTVNNNGFLLTINGGDTLIENAGGNSYVANVGNEVVLGGANGVFIDNAVLNLNGSYSGGNDPEIAFNKSVGGTGQLTSLHTAARSWSLPDLDGTLIVGSSEVYTPSNVTPDRSFDADTVVITELADVVGTLIADLQAVGLLQ